MSRVERRVRGSGPKGSAGGPGRRSRRPVTAACGAAAALVLVALTLAPDARALPPWAARPSTLPAGVWALDFGLGVSHATDSGSAGANMEMAAGLADRLEVGVRTGFRFGDAGARIGHADEYGRLFDRQYAGGGADPVANPELRVRGALVRGEALDLALEGRLFVPLEAGTDAGLEAGVPMAVHLGQSVRLDTGVYLPLLFTQPGATYAARVPLDAWIQASPKVWVGPMTGVAFEHPAGGAPSASRLSLGAGFGYQVAPYFDFKAQFLFPDINDNDHDFGLGAGVELRIE